LEFDSGAFVEGLVACGKAPPKQAFALKVGKQAAQ